MSCPRAGTLDAWLRIVQPRYVLLVSLLSSQDELNLGLSDEAARFRARGGRFVACPIDDFSVPDEVDSFVEVIDAIHADLAAGRSAAVHCRGGIGRSGMVACAVLIRDGCSLENAIETVTNARGHRVPETDEQHRWLAKHVDRIRRSRASSAAR